MTPSDAAFFKAAIARRIPRFQATDAALCAGGEKIMDITELQAFADQLGAKILAGLPAAIAAGITLADAAREAKALADAQARARDQYDRLQANDRMAASFDAEERARRLAAQSAELHRADVLARAHADREKRERIVAEANAVGMPIDLDALPKLPEPVIDEPEETISN
jgi:hypothetical protein